MNPFVLRQIDPLTSSCESHHPIYQFRIGPTGREDAAVVDLVNVNIQDAAPGSLY